MGKHKLLIVDDSLMMREFIKSNITESFPEVETFEAANGKDAQLKIKAVHL